MPSFCKVVLKLGPTPLRVVTLSSAVGVTSMRCHESGGKTATPSISIAAPLGSWATPMAARAG